MPSGVFKLRHLSLSTQCFTYSAWKHTAGSQLTCLEVAFLILQDPEFVDDAEL